MARILVQATLPHSRPKTHEFERVNGRFTLYMNAPNGSRPGARSIGLGHGAGTRWHTCSLSWPLDPDRDNMTLDPAVDSTWSEPLGYCCGRDLRRVQSSMSTFW